ncbi:MAG: GspH/FimT family protein [Marinobacter sp.]|nr:GspH/FimT family protein [Marinobacter sp.]
MHKDRTISRHNAPLSGGGSRGFTLIELLIAIIIAGILLAVVVPGFQGVVEGNRVVTQANQLVGAINYARSEAIRRGTPVVFAGQGGTFANGWCVHDGNGCAGAGLLRMFPAPDGVVVVANVAEVTFDNQGRSQAPGGVVTLSLRPPSCDPGTPNAQTDVVIGPTGRAVANRVDCQ